MKVTTISVLVAMVGVAWVVIKNLRIPMFFDFPSSAYPSTTETMTAVVYRRHGDSFVLEMDSNFPKPIPQDDQVLVEVYATSVSPLDCALRRNWVPSFLIPKPKIPGADVAGVVIEVGTNVTTFRKGDRVAAFMPLLGSRWGSSAEFVAVRESFLCKIPDSLSFVKAASLPLVALTVVQSFEHLENPSNTKKILIQGGSGGVGTFAIQYAKKLLHMEVITTVSAGKTKLVKALGADHVIDYHTQDFRDVVKEVDIVFDPMSWKYERATLNEGKHIIRNDGHYLNILSSGIRDGKEISNIIASFLNIIRHWIANLVSPGSIPKYTLVLVQPDGASLHKVFDLVERGTITCVIDPQIFDLYELYDAHMYLERHYAIGKVVVRVKHEELITA